MTFSWLTRLRDAGAVWEYLGHGPHAAFQMAPIHAGFYFNTGIVTQNAELTTEIIAHFSDFCCAASIKPDWVASYVADIATGKVFAEALATAIGARAGMIDLRDERKSFFPRPRETVLIITDDIVSGGSLRKTVTAIEAQQAIVLSPILTLGNFLGAAQIDGRDIVSLFERQIELWPADNCPLCKSGSPVLKTRTQWYELCTHGCPPPPAAP